MANLEERKIYKKITTSVLQKMKNDGEKISMLTAYDYSIATIIDRAGMDVILVGDSASNVMAGNPTTLLLTLDQIIYHAQCVVRATQRAHVVVDMPFGSYQVSPEDGIRSAVRIMKETGAGSVKIEGGEEVLTTIKRIIDAGVPVMGHLGLMPQSINKYGSYKLRASEDAEAEKLLNDAKLLEKAGCYAIVLEKIPALLAEKVAQTLSIPVIGIGAGEKVDGQVLVMHDMLGLFDGFHPKFARVYANLYDEITKAVKQYVSDVKSLEFPNKEEQY